MSRLNMQKQGFPVEECLEDLFNALQKSNTLILEAPPGAGKTTLIPLHLLGQKWLTDQKILLLEARRLAAKTAARRMASLLHEKVGETVGYRIKGERKTSSKTRIEVVTEGILTRMLQNDPSLEGIGLVIFDEFHERSLQGDLGLAFCLDTIDALRDDLKIMIMSATLAGQDLEKLFPDAPIIKSQGRQFPVEIRYEKRPNLHELCLDIHKLILRCIQHESGSLLVFLPGEGEIRRTSDLLFEILGSDKNIIIAPLYSRLDNKEQDIALQKAPNGFRKIVLATTIAETSLTIDGIRMVIDCGYKRISRFDENRSQNILETVRVSKASADQRTGRAGRLEAGISYRLWPEPENRVLLDRDQPEILNTDLAPLALELAAWGVKSTHDLKLLDHPNEKFFAGSQKLLQDMDILDENRLITSHGKDIAKLNLHPRLAHMVLWAQGLSKGHQKLACLIAGYLEESSRGSKNSADFTSDLEEILKMKSAKWPLSKAYQSYQNLCKRLNIQNEKTAQTFEAGRLLAQAFPDRIGKQRLSNSCSYQLSSGQGAQLNDKEKLSHHNFIVVANMGMKGANGLIYQALPLSFDELLNDFAERITEQEIVGWDEKTEKLVAKKSRFLFALEMKSEVLQNPDPSLITNGLYDFIRKKSLDVLNWTDDVRNLRNRITCLKIQDPEKTSDLPEFNDDILLQNLEDWLGPYISECQGTNDLKKLDIFGILKSRLSWEQLQALEQQTPLQIKVPSGAMKKIDYHDPKHPSLNLKLQEMFGTDQTPSILSGQLNLRLHLLSPAGRPLQVTDDIGRFWETSYDSIKKEMKGRYPKHPWPDDPLTAVASAKTKRHLGN